MLSARGTSSAIEAIDIHMSPRQRSGGPRNQHYGVDPELIQRLSRAGVTGLARGCWGGRERQHGPNTLHHRRIETSATSQTTDSRKIRDTASWYASTGSLHTHQRLTHAVGTHRRKAVAPLLQQRARVASVTLWPSRLHPPGLAVDSTSLDPDQLAAEVEHTERPVAGAAPPGHDKQRLSECAAVAEDCRDRKCRGPARFTLTAAVAV